MSSSNKFISLLKDYPLAVICVLVIAVCAAVIFLRSSHYDELTAMEADLNARIRTIDLNVKNAKDLQVQVEELELLVEQVEARLFVRQQRSVNLNFFYDIQDRLDVRISNLNQLPAPDQAYAKGGPRELKLHSTIAFNISLNGRFDDILGFLYELYRIDRLVRVADLQMVSSDTGAEQGNLEARLRVVVLSANAAQ